MSLTIADMKDLLGRRVRVFSAGDPTHVMGEGEIVAVCDAPTITLLEADGSRSHHSINLPREEIPRPKTCSQCGQRTPICADCGDSIIFVPKAGFGNTGEWQHIEVSRVHVGAHQPRPRVFVS